MLLIDEYRRKARVMRAARVLASACDIILFASLGIGAGFAVSYFLF